MNEEPIDLPTLTLENGEATARVGEDSETDLIAALDLDASAISIRERITLRGLHSTGGIGEVWRAYDETLGREIALKRLKFDKAESASNRARFLREARLTSQLDHPGIVPVYDFSSNEDGTHCFYTMRFLRGRTLREVIAEFHEHRIGSGSPLVGGHFIQLLGNFASICNTISFAHSRKVIHRDLKGDNVIIGDFGEVVVLDWGLAKQLGTDTPDFDEASQAVFADLAPGETMQGEQLGTPAYMAPEQAAGEIEAIDFRTDVYALAAILYEILTGRAPFRGPDVATILAAVLSQAPIPPTQVVADVPPELEAICLRGLSKAQEDRPQSVAEFAREVQGWLDALAERKRTQAERERFFDLSLDLLVIVDERHGFVQSNAAWASLLGWTDEQRSDAKLLDFVVEEDRPAAEVALARLWSGESTVPFETRVKTSDGSSRWIDWLARTLPGERTLYLVGRDVTERKLAEHEFRALLDSAPDAMLVVDPSGAIRLANKQVETLFGWPPADLVGRTIDILMPDRLQSNHAAHMAAFVASPRPRRMGEGRQLFARHRDGREFAVDISLSPVEGRSGRMIICALRPKHDTE